MPRVVQVSCIIDASSAPPLAGVVEGLCPTCGQDVQVVKPARPHQAPNPLILRCRAHTAPSWRPNPAPILGNSRNTSTACAMPRGRGTHGDPGPAARAGRPRHRAGRRCGSSSLLPPVGRAARSPQGTKKPQTGDKGHFALPARPRRSTAAPRPTWKVTRDFSSR